jgi:hypothetical protein
LRRRLSWRGCGEGEFSQIETSIFDISAVVLRWSHHNSKEFQMRSYTVAIDVIDLLRDLFQVTIKPTEQNSTATAVRRYEDLLIFSADMRKYFNMTERAITKILSGDNDHSMLFNQTLNDAAAKHFNYTPPPTA